MLVASIVVSGVFVAAAVSSSVGLLRVRAIWRDPVFDDIAWRAVRRRGWWAVFTTVAVVLVDMSIGAVPGAVGVGALLLVSLEYLVVRRFRADVYLQRRVAWEAQMRAHLAMPDAVKGE
ncbi:hypothetical protein [Mycobacteroides abscessus]|uniref:hypothetical protein n=1 Tax=Mycobacteroides abscessus TaxID=36809 RepID=UPI0021054F8C|nr:hypothetical protein [Mycobacteroides abscessus]